MNNRRQIEKIEKEIIRLNQELVKLKTSKSDKNAFIQQFANDDVLNGVSESLFGDKYVFRILFNSTIEDKEKRDELQGRAFLVAKGYKVETGDTLWGTWVSIYEE